MKAAISFLFVFTAFVACKNTTHEKRSNNPLNKGNQQKGKLVELDSFVKNSIDTAQYLALPYYDSTMEHAGSIGYIDTFTIHQQRFRIVHRDTMFDGVVEAYRNGKWYRTKELYPLGMHADYDVSQDVDRDRHRDLVYVSKWYSDIYLFDTVKNGFSDTANCSVAPIWSLLDTVENIYYEAVLGKLMNSDNPAQSKLFTFKQARRIDIASYEMN